MYRKVAVFCLLLILAGIGTFWYARVKQPPEEVDQTFSVNGIDFGYKKATSTAPVPHRAIPDLSRQLSGVSTSTRIAYAGVVARLKTYPNDTDSWIALGLYRKENDDYKGAEEAWKYALVLSPADPQPNDNLGVLYGYYLHNNTLAEQNILKSIEKAPLMTMYYLRAVEFYREVLKDTAKARSIVEKGLKLAPQNPDLLALHAELK